MLSHLSKQERATLRSLLFRAFNRLHDPQTSSKAIEVLVDQIAEAIDAAGPVMFLSPTIQLKQVNYQGLIKKFHGFILHPGQGLLSVALERMSQAVLADTNEGTAMLAEIVETQGLDIQGLELVRGEDGSEPDRS